MAHKALYTFILLLLSVHLWGQISFEASNLPTPGDTFIIATDHLPSGIQIGPAGEAINWDFTTLQSAYASRVFVLPVDEDRMAGINQVDAVMKGLNNSNRLLAYRGGIISEVGRRINSPFKEFQKLDGYLSTELPWLQPLQYNQEDQSESYLYVSLDVDKLSYGGQYSWAKPGLIARLVYHIERSWAADAWGRLRIPFGTYDVIRQHVFEDIEGSLEVQNAMGQWVVLSDQITGIDLPSIRLESYYFWSNELDHPVAIVEIGQNQGSPEKVHYKAFEFNAKVVNRISSRADVFVYPNPAFDIVRFDLANLLPGEYNIAIFDILGREIESFKVEVDGYTTVQLDLSFLKKGTYIYRVSNSQNNSITSKRLVIIQP